MKKSIELEQVNVTPAQAALWLEERVKNRPLKAAWVNIIAEDIRAGNWSEHTYNWLKFNDKGQLIDGQHRCAAIANAGRIVPVYVQYDAQDTSFIDNNQERSFIDHAALKGVELNKKVVASAWLASKGTLYSKSAGTPSQINTALKAMGEGAKFAYEVAGSNAHVTYPIYAAIAKAFHNKVLDRTKVKEFTSAIATPGQSSIKAVEDLKTILVYNKEITKAVNNRVKLFLITYRAIAGYCLGHNVNVKTTDFACRPKELMV